MCGVVAVVGPRDARELAERALVTLRHRGPDTTGTWSDPEQDVALAHARLSIIDLSAAANQPMASPDGRFVIAFNGEIYNYVELRCELGDHTFRSHSDTEVVLAAWSRWGPACLDRMLGMFAFALWDSEHRRLFVVRDRFGVKPMYVARLPADRGIVVASEIKAIHAAGLPPERDPVAWASFLIHGLCDAPGRTFWRNVTAVPPGTYLAVDRDGVATMTRWYDLAERVGDTLDERDDATVRDELVALLEDSVRLRFRADVPVGINLSGGLDSSLLLRLVEAIHGPDHEVTAFTFGTGEPTYDELPWVRAMLGDKLHLLVESLLAPDEVPALAAQVMAAEDEPYGGVPTLAYAKLFKTARERGVIVLLDGQGLDEQWAGYDYYRSTPGTEAATVQGARDPLTRPEAVSRELAEHAVRLAPPSAFPDRLRNLQLRDVTQTKLPRALRYNDRISMAASTELREPFLDHRLFELAFRQPAARKVHGDTGKWLIREIARDTLPPHVRAAPKRPVQTPQREWLRGPLRDWADSCIERAFREHASWFDVEQARAAWRRYQAGVGDNSYWVWQWLSLGLG